MMSAIRRMRPRRYFTLIRSLEGQLCQVEGRRASDFTSSFHRMVYGDGPYVTPTIIERLEASTGCWNLGVGGPEVMST